MNKDFYGGFAGSDGDEIISMPIQEGETLMMMERVDEIAPLLPETLRRVIVPFDSTGEKVMVLAATIGLTGALLPKVWFTYHNRKTYVMLMMMFVAPPASGKGVLRYPKQLLKKIDNELFQKNKEAWDKFRLEEAEWKQRIKKDQEAPPPIPPKTILLLVPGNVSSAALIKQLTENGPDNPILIYEMEADAFGITSSKGDFGGQNSTILRSLFHSERVSQLRKTDSEHLYVEEPKGVVIFSGTESQLQAIFRSNQDGLFSRFMFITLKGSTDFHNVFAKSAHPLDEHFHGLEGDYYELWKFFKDKEVEVKFTEDQEQMILRYGELMYRDTHNFLSQYADSLVFRHANMLARIVVTVRMIRYYEGKETEQVAYCSDDDLNTGLWLANLSLRNALELFQKLPGERVSLGNLQQKKLWEILPESFKIKDIRELQAELGLTDRTLERYLKTLVDSGSLEHLSKGEYKKNKGGGIGGGGKSNN